MLRCASLTVIVALGALAGCADPKRDLASYPQPIFDVPSSRPATKPTVMRPSSGAASERGWRPAQGISRRWTEIVIHHSGGARGGAKAFDAYHRNVRNWDELGYHFVIGNGTDTRDGEVEVGSRWAKQKHGAHCKTPDNHYNDHGIGICLVGDFNQAAPTRAQLASLRRLLAYLSQQCRIPASKIHTHSGVTRKTQCPGRHFPLATVRREAALANRVSLGK